MGYSDESLDSASTVAQKPGDVKPVASDPFVGTGLEGRYLVDRKLGEGGFGSVYLASDIKVNSRKVVIKILHAEETSNDWSRKKFQQEFEALARLKHPSIVSVLDGGETSDGRPYIVMEYINGASLRSLINEGPFAFERIANIVQQVGRALTTAHQAGILHRDLKPENIMIENADGDEYVKVIDFGIAKVKNSVVDVVTAKEVAVGTIAYMSPEQLRAQPISTTSDVYALGVISYEMITGKRPLNPDSAYQLLELQRAGIRVNPSALRPNLGAEAEKILLKALSFEASDRFERAREFGDQLASALLVDDEKTLVAEPTKKVGSTDASPETAHVLFMDIVGYSRLLIDEQTNQLRKLQQFVSATNECQRAKTNHQLIALPTGDGMALVFFNDPEAPLRCAIEVTRALHATPEIKLRMGVHSGLIYRMEDIQNNMNVAGGGINIAQRVMDCGDEGHILVSKRVADDLGQLARWSNYLQDLGPAEVKHGVIIHIFSLVGEDFGNSATPRKLEKEETRPGNRRVQIIAATAIFLLAALGFGLWRFSKSRETVASNATATAPVVIAGPERVITYWLNVQKVLNRKSIGEEFQSAGDIVFGNGWRFQFNLNSNGAGALYLLNVGPARGGIPEYNILFPLSGSSHLQANQTMKSDWLRFVDQTGVERLWLIWSAQPIPELDQIFVNAAANKEQPGVVTNAAEIATIQTYLKRQETSGLEIVHHKENKQTLLRGRGDLLVALIELSHEAY